MSRHRAASAVARIALLVGLVAGLAACSASSSEFDSGLSIGAGGIVQWDPGKGPVLPAVAGTTIAGTPLDLAAWKGDVVVLNVWGSWCDTCKQESPTMASVSRQVAAQGVRFVGVDVQDHGDRAAAQSFQQKYRITYPSLDDQDGTISLTLRKLLVGTQYPPQTLVIGRDGRAVGRISQGADKSVLLGLLQQAGVQTGSGSPAYSSTLTVTTDEPSAAPSS